MTRKHDRKGVAGALACMAVGMALSVGIALRLHREEEARLRVAFVHEIRRLAALVDEQIGEDIAILHATKALFDASQEVERHEFHVFANFVLARYPSMRAVGWVPLTTIEERPGAEERARRDGFPDFEFTETTPTGGLRRAGHRADYYPVYYIEPLAGNEAALAFDLASNPDRSKTLQAARDTGQARATPRIHLVQEPEEEWAVLVFIPVYRGAPRPEPERFGKFVGVVSGVFRLHDVLQAAGAHLPDDGLVDLRLVDASEPPEAVLLHHIHAAESELVTAWRHEQPLKPAAGRTWKLVATPTTAYLAANRTNEPLVGLLAGLLLSAFLSYYIASIVRQKQRVEAEVRHRTRELNEQAEALRRANDELSHEAARRRSLQESLAKLTDHEQRRLGQELHDSLGQQIAVVVMLAHSLKTRLGKASEAIAPLLAALTDGAQNAQTQVRALSRGVLPVEVAAGGLRAALDQLVESTQGISDTRVVLRCDREVRIDDRDAATHLYRITQEALRNALEHGRAKQVEVCLHQEDHTVTLVVQDDGWGVDSEKATGGAGMAGMRHRADLIGATLTIETREPQGTSVTCRLPLSGDSGSAQTG